MTKTCDPECNGFGPSESCRSFSGRGGRAGFGPNMSCIHSGDLRRCGFGINQWWPRRATGVWCRLVVWLTGLIGAGLQWGTYACPKTMIDNKAGGLFLSSNSFANFHIHTFLKSLPNNSLCFACAIAQTANYNGSDPRLGCAQSHYLQSLLAIFHWWYNWAYEKGARICG